MDSTHLAKSIKKARIDAGMTQDELSDQADISYSTLAKIEQGAIKEPSIYTVRNIANVVGVSIDQLVGAKPSRKSAASVSSKPSRQRIERTLDNGIQFVYFDIGGVMLHFKAVIDAIAESVDANKNKVRTIFWKYNDPVTRGNMTVPEVEFALQAELNLKPGIKVDYFDTFKKFAKPIKESHRFVKSIDSRIDVGLLSNIYPGSLPIMQTEKLVPDANFQCIVQSFDVGAVKPERTMFKIAEEMANVPASSILLVDDTKANVAAATELGWRAVWFDENHPEVSLREIREEYLSELFE